MVLKTGYFGKLAKSTRKFLDVLKKVGKNQLHGSCEK
jgi:hypothetical protein